MKEGKKERKKESKKEEGKSKAILLLCFFTMLKKHKSVAIKRLNLFLNVIKYNILSFARRGP